MVRSRQVSLSIGLAVAAGLFWFAGCGDDPLEPSEAVAAVVVTPGDATLEVGETQHLTATAKNAAATTLDRDFTWLSSQPSVATVDPEGLVTAVASGSATITATAGGQSGSATIAVPVPVATLTIDGDAIDLVVGETTQLTGRPMGSDGRQVQRAVSWTSTDPAVATVDAAGLVMGTGLGHTTIIGTCGRVADTVEVTVGAPGASLVIADPGMEPLHVDSTRQLSATVRDAGGNVLAGYPLTWSSSDPNIATVDDGGRVTGTGRGTATITASGAVALSASVGIRVVGETEDGGNNLSYPVVFAEGIGVTGLPVGEDAGLRPTAAEGIAVTHLPFFWDGNRPDYQTYYLQQGANVWQAQWVNGAGGPAEPAEVAWGDNLTHHTFGTHAMIRVEVVLNAYTRLPLTGYRMYSLYGSQGSEMQGTDGTTVDTIPTIFSVTPRLRIEKLDDNRVPVHTVFDGAIHEGLASEGHGSFGAEINVGGKVIYGFNLQIRNLTFPANVHKYGWYRLTFSLDATATVGGVTVTRNVALGRLATSSEDEAPLYLPQIDTANNVSWLEIYVESSSGGGGGGGGGGSGSW